MIAFSKKKCIFITIVFFYAYMLYKGYGYYTEILVFSSSFYYLNEIYVCCSRNVFSFIFFAWNRISMDCH